MPIFYLEPPESEELKIPAHLLGTHRALQLDIACSTPITMIKNNEKMMLTIDQDSFRSSLETLQRMYINNCDLSRLKFDFLAGFDKLQVLHIQTSSNVGKARWNDLPPLPILKYLKIGTTKPADWNEWAINLPTLVNGLMVIVLTGGSLGNDATNSIMQWLLESSLETLEQIEMLGTQLTRIPRQLSYFKRLSGVTIGCRGSNILVLERSSFKFSVPVRSIEIFDCGIQELKPGAFQGRLYRLYITTDDYNFGKKTIEHKESTKKFYIYDTILNI